MSSDHQTEPAVLLFHGRGAISALIRWQTRSRYSHAALRLRDGRIVEAWQGCGVRIRELPAGPGIEAYRVRGLSASRWDTALRYACAQVGAGYDYWGVVRFISRRRLPANLRWFCSELVFSSLQSVGVTLLTRIDASEVSPGMLALSPRLKRIE
jgi:uncharacterized protein YycO